MYAKLFSRIAQSSLMEEDVETRYCFMMLLAIADSTGDVIGTDVALARTVNLPLDTFQRCIAELMKPDPNSNSQEQEGRRVILSESGRGYFIVNYGTYRSLRTAEEKKAYMREYMRRYRKDKDGNDVTDVNVCKTKLSVLAQEEGDSEEDKKKSKITEAASPSVVSRIPPEQKPNKAKGTREEVTSFFRELRLPPFDAEWFFEKCEGCGWKNGGKPILDWKATVRSWNAAGYMPSQKQSGNGFGKPARTGPVGTRSNPLL